MCPRYYCSGNWSELFAMGEFAYNNTMHSLIQQTLFFANHGLHPKIDIQGVHKIVNPVAEDRAMWLTHVRTQFISNLEEA